MKETLCTEHLSTLHLKPNILTGDYADLHPSVIHGRLSIKDEIFESRWYWLISQP